MGKIVEKCCQTILHDVSGHKLTWCIFPHRLTATAYIGCTHDCRYCYAKWYAPAGKMTVKVNAAERLRKELKNRIQRNKPLEPVCLGSISDPYQPIEQRYQITRRMLRVCDELDYPVFIVTKSNLILRDKDILRSLAQRNLVAVNFTLTPLSEETLFEVEPNAPATEKRLEAIKVLSANGVRCGVYLSPIFPFLSENRLKSLIIDASECGAVCCSSIFLKIRPIVWRYFKEFLRHNFPSLVGKYEELYFKRGDRDLSSYRLPEYSYRREKMQEISEICSNHSLGFTSEEFFDLWTTSYSDCVDINCWHAPTSYDLWRYLKNQRGKWVTLDEAMKFIETNFQVDEKYFKTLGNYWKDGTIFHNSKDVVKNNGQQIKYRWNSRRNRI